MAPSLSAGQPTSLRRGGFYQPPLSQGSSQCPWDQGAPCTGFPGALLLWVDSECLHRTFWPQGPCTKLPPTAQPHTPRHYPAATALLRPAGLCLQQRRPPLRAPWLYQRPDLPQDLTYSWSPCLANSTGFLSAPLDVSK